MESLLNTEQILKLIPVSRRTLYGWCQAKKIPHYRAHGSLLFFKASEIEAWLEKKPPELEDGQAAPVTRRRRSA